MQSPYFILQIVVELVVNFPRFGAVCDPLSGKASPDFDVFVGRFQPTQASLNGLGKCFDGIRVDQDSRSSHTIVLFDFRCDHSLNPVPGTATYTTVSH